VRQNNGVSQNNCAVAPLKALGLAGAMAAVTGSVPVAARNPIVEGVPVWPCLFSVSQTQKPLFSGEKSHLWSARRLRRPVAPRKTRVFGLKNSV